MNIPKMSPPIQRQAVGSPSQQAQPTQGERTAQSLPDWGTGYGVVPSDVQDCYKLRGLAQNLCLADY